MLSSSFRNLNQELIVSNANKLDEGLYDCLAVNDLGTITSNSVKVTVIGEWVIYLLDWNHKSF